MSPRFVAAIITLNLVAPFVVSQRANEVMQKQPEGGSIINISSLCGLRPSPGTAAYGAAKAGLINLTESLAVEFAPKVRVNCVTAGALETDELHNAYGGDAYFEAVAATVPLGRMGRPPDVAKACLFLASEAASFITGANLLVHGGGDDPPPVTGERVTVRALLSPSYRESVLWQEQADCPDVPTAAPPRIGRLCRRGCGVRGRVVRPGAGPCRPVGRRARRPRRGVGCQQPQRRHGHSRAEGRLRRRWSGRTARWAGACTTRSTRPSTTSRA